MHVRTDNITAVKDLSSLFANVGNVRTDSASQADNGKGFKAVMVSKVSDTSLKTDDGRNGVSKNSARDILTASPGTAIHKSDTDVDENAILEAAVNMVNTIAEKLDITPDELMDALSEISAEITDLAMPDRAAQLLLEVKDVDSLDIVTDEELGRLLTDITDEAGQIISEVSKEFEIDPKALKDMIDVKAADVFSEHVTQAEETVTSIVRDEATGREIKVTFDNESGHRTEAVKTETVSADGTNESLPVTGRKEETGHDNPDMSQGQNNAAHNGAAENLLSGLAQGMETAQGSEITFSDSYVSYEDILKQMIDSIRVNVTADTSSMELQLTPESLGKINLNVVTKNGEVTATITAQNDTVKAAIESQLIELKENLNNQGLKVSSVEVTVASQGFDFNRETAEHNNQGSRKNGTRFREITDLPDEETLTDSEEILMARGSSVSYQA